MSERLKELQNTYHDLKMIVQGANLIMAISPSTSTSSQLSVYKKLLEQYEEAKGEYWEFDNKLRAENWGEK